MKILVCGGAGYVGSHAVAELLDQGYEVVVADNLEKGHREAVPSSAKLLVGDLRDKSFTDSIFENEKIDAVIDFAAYSLVGESVFEPMKYFYNNMYGTMNLVSSMQKHGVNFIVFSSTAATYGEPKNIPILETDPTIPTNPYGETKLCVEKMLKWTANATDLRYCVLRYFNVAGAHVSGKIGEDHQPESHLIPNVLAVALGKKDKLSLFGNDYNTPDGTCVRDYIHVTDLAAAHILALEKIIKENVSLTYNLGNGQGFSNLQIIETARKVTGKEIPYTVEPRRAGDPSTLVASSEKAIKELNWQPKYNSLETIIETAWKWHESHPNGY